MLLRKTIIAAASYYNKNYFFDDAFKILPPQIKKEIKHIVITASEKSKGVFCISFDENGDIILETGGLDNDYTYDEIEGKLQIKKIEKEQAELLNKLALWRKAGTHEKRSKC